MHTCKPITAHTAPSWPPEDINYNLRSGKRNSSAISIRLALSLWNNHLVNYRVKWKKIVKKLKKKKNVLSSCQCKCICEFPCFSVLSRHSFRVHSAAGLRHERVTFPTPHRQLKMIYPFSDDLDCNFGQYVGIRHLHGYGIGGILSSVGMQLENVLF